MANAKCARVVLLPGDGIGPEVVASARSVLEASCAAFDRSVDFSDHLIGGAAIAATESPLPEATIAACRNADAVLLGAVGDPRYDDPALAVRPEQGLLGLRRQLSLFANIRPIQPIAALIEKSSPLRPEYLADVDLVIVRELTGGIYFGEPRERREREGEVEAIDTMRYRTSEVERIARRAFDMARARKRKVTSVDKANVLECSRLWREVVEKVAGDYADVRFEHQLVDSCAMKLINDAKSFDVVLTSNMFGDILSDEAAAIVGSLGMLPSASFGAAGAALYEPVHGSAPQLAGQGVANPLGTILSAALLLRHSLDLPRAADALERAVIATVAGGTCTPDLGGSATTMQVTAEVIAKLAA